jgi:hypothetical protein
MSLSSRLNFTLVSGGGTKRCVNLVADSAKHFRRVPAPWAGTSQSTPR